MEILVGVANLVSMFKYIP